VETALKTAVKTAVQSASEAAVEVPLAVPATIPMELVPNAGADNQLSPATHERHARSACQAGRGCLLVRDDSQDNDIRCLIR
jgi:hypothetical protein